MAVNNDWKHLKTGKIYVVIGFAIDCTNERAGTQVVVYIEKGVKGGEVFVRDFKEFADEFEPMDKAYFAFREKVLGF